jgi:hypothetical protein
MSQTRGNPFAQKPKFYHQLFSANGTFTVPAGVNAVKVTVIGGGSGYRPCWCCCCNGDCCFQPATWGGGSGGVAIKTVTGLTPGQTISVTVGATGGTSSFGTYCSATGTLTAQAGQGVNGDINLSGGTGLPYHAQTGNGIVWTNPVGSYFGGCNYGANQQMSNRAVPSGAVLVEWLA